MWQKQLQACFRIRPLQTKIFPTNAELGLGGGFVCVYVCVFLQAQVRVWDLFGVPRMTSHAPLGLKPTHSGPFPAPLGQGCSVPILDLDMEGDSRCCSLSGQEPGEPDRKYHLWSDVALWCLQGTAKRGNELKYNGRERLTLGLEWHGATGSKSSCRSSRGMWLAY